MTPGTHQLSREAFTALAEGGGGAEALTQLLAARRSKNLVLLRALVDLTAAAGHEATSLTNDAYRKLSEIERLAPRSVTAVLSYPAVRAWVLDTAISLHEGRLTGAQPARLAAVAAAAAVRGGVPGTFDIPMIDRSGRTLTLPSLGTGTFSIGTSDIVRLCATPGGAMLRRGQNHIDIPADPSQDAPHWRGIRLISAECAGMQIDVRVDGAGPYYLPGTVTVHEYLLDHQLGVWRASIADGWRVLVEHHRETAAEASATFTALAPLSSSRAGQVSATFQDAFGCLAMSLPPTARQTALTLAHEVQHAKLNALMDLFPLIEPGSEELGYAPWRDDPRPLVGLLQGTYAHLGIAGFWRRQRHQERDRTHVRLAEVEFARWRAAAREVAGFLASTGKLTPQGQNFVAAMHRVLDAWCAEDLPAEVRAISQRLGAQHRERWVTTHGNNPPRKLINQNVAGNAPSASRDVPDKVADTPTFAGQEHLCRKYSAPGLTWADVLPSAC